MKHVNKNPQIKQKKIKMKKKNSPTNIYNIINNITYNL